MAVEALGTDYESAVIAILSIVTETKSIVSRIDDRDRHASSKRLYSIVLQEACFRYWEAGQNKAELRFGRRGRVMYEDVFIYFRRELVSIGVKDWGTFRRILRARSKRICKQQNEGKFDLLPSSPGNTPHPIISPVAASGGFSVSGTSPGRLLRAAVQILKNSACGAAPNLAFLRICRKKKENNR